jgi:hypothetical protein
MLVGYGVFQIVSVATGPGRYDEYLSDPAMAKMLGPIGDLHTTASYATYASVIAISIVFQGGTALYYHHKKTNLVAYLNETPGWVLALQRK